MKLLKKFINQAIAKDALPSLGEYPINFYKPKKDNTFLSYISRKNPFAYYLLQTNMPNETLTEDPLGVRIGRLFSGSKTRKMDPRTGTLSNSDYGSTQKRERPDYVDINQLRKSLMGTRR